MVPSGNEGSVWRRVTGATGKAPQPTLSLPGNRASCPGDDRHSLAVIRPGGQVSRSSNAGHVQCTRVPEDLASKRSWDAGESVFFLELWGRLLPEDRLCVRRRDVPGL